VKAPPRRLFREPRAREPRPRDILSVDEGDDRRFLELMRLLGADAHREIDRMSEEAGSVLILIFFARFRGWRRAKIGGRVFDLTGTLPGRWRVVPEALPQSLREVWEAMP
jgi:hypothetical protein